MGDPESPGRLDAKVYSFDYQKLVIGEQTVFFETLNHQINMRILLTFQNFKRRPLLILIT